MSDKDKQITGKPTHQAWVSKTGKRQMIVWLQFKQFFGYLIRNKLVITRKLENCNGHVQFRVRLLV